MSDQNQNKANQVVEEDIGEARRVRNEKLNDLIQRGKNPFEIVSYERTATAGKILSDYDAYDGKDVSVAGRLVSKRVMGKASFGHIMDNDGKIQGYFSRDDMGVEEYQDFKKLDVGDIIGIVGFVFKTKTGEISLHVKKVTLLSKAMLPLPEKYHGLKNPELRYRQRYVDLIANPEVKDIFVKRSKIISAVREFLDGEGFIEVETPVLNTLAGGANARPFITHHNTLDVDMYMRIATELYLKRLIVGGFEKVYEMGRIFRNEGMDPKHNPEFTSVELYQAYVDYNAMMDIAERLTCFCAEKACGTLEIEYQGEHVSLKRPWQRLTMVEAVKKYCDIDFDNEKLEDAIKKANALGLELPPDTSWGNALYKVFDSFVEEKLQGPVFITDYPVEVSPLAKKKPTDNRLTERFELFITCRELANAFSELNDPNDQRERFKAQMAEKAKGDDEAQPYDEDFCTALDYGMPPTGGLGIGIDRLVMLLTDAYSIREVLLFPTMKPLDSDKKINKVTEAPTTSVVDEKIDFSNVQIEPLFEEMVDFDTFSKSDFRAVKVKECEAVKKSKKLLKFVLDDGTGTDRVILSGIHMYYEPEELVGKTLLAITNLPPRPMMGIESCGMLISAVHSENDEERLHLIMLDPHIPAGAKMY